MVRSYFSAYSVTILCASLKEMVSFAPWKQFSIVGILACQQAVFWSTSETNSITILLSHCLALPYWQRGAERRLELKSGLSHTFTLPSQSTPTMSSLGRKLPTSVCNFSKPVNALTNTYRLYGSGTSLMTLSRQGVCQRQTLASTLHPQQVSSLVSQKYLVATMASCCIRQRKDCMYCWQWSPWRVSWYCSMRSLVRTFLKSLQCPCRAFLRTDGGSGISCQCSLAMRGRRWASDQLEPIRVVKQIIVIYFPICPHRTVHLPCVSFVKLLQNFAIVPIYSFRSRQQELFGCSCLVLYCLQLMAVKQIEGYSIFMTKVLGKGSYGSVYLAKQQSTGQQVAAKILSKDSIDRDQYLKAALKNEIDIIQKLHSDNIVGFYDVMESSKNYYIIQELCDGDLAGEIKPGMQRPEAEAVEMLRQICNGFLALVKEGIIHRDLKPANVMKKGKVLKLGDFGFAKQMGPKSMVSTCVGTPLYMSLQILKGEEYTSKCDIWALGFIFYQILHGDTPWTANTELQLIRNIEKQPLTIRRKGLSPETEDFLRRCLQLTEDKRISWDQIFVHPIFRGYFQGKCDGQQFQNKMKMIMNKLRFYISQKNLDLKKIMDSLGFTANKKEISYHEFYHFFQHVYPEISNEDADYLFKKTDTDHSGAMSVQELKTLLVNNGIKLQAQFDAIPSFQKRSDGKETFQRISAQASRKIKSCFQKLYRIITRNGLTLWKVFNDFDKKKGSLTLAEFTLLIRKISSGSNDISEDEIKCGFELIDEDGSNSIQFAELDKYYSKVNGIPQASAPKNYEPMQIESEGQTTQSPPNRSQNQTPQQNQYQQYPQQPYPPQYGTPPNYPPPQQYQAYQYPPQGYPQQQGYMNYSNNNGNMNVPMGGFGYNNSPYNYPMNNGGFPEQNAFNSSQGFNRPPPPQNQPPQNQNYNTNFNPFDMLSRRI